MKIPLPSRIPILYLVLTVLIGVGVFPLYFYATKVVEMNREQLKLNEKLLQNTVATALSQDIAQRGKDIRSTLASLAYSVQIASGGNLGGLQVQSPEIRALLENYIENPDSIVPFARLVNAEGRTMALGTISPDAFLEKDLERGLAAARDGREYSGSPLSVDNGKESRTMMEASRPVLSGTHSLHALESVVDLPSLPRNSHAAQTVDH